MTTHPEAAPARAELIERSEAVRRMLRMHPGYVGTSDAVNAWMDAAIAALSLAESRGRQIGREEAAKVAETYADNSKGCPFNEGHPDYWKLDITEDDPCPTCRQTGREDGSKCLGSPRNAIAAAIRNLPSNKEPK